jgi:hypothetical protein
MESLLAGESVQADDLRHELAIWEWVYQGLLEENPTPRFVDAYALFLLGADHLNGAAVQLRSWLETSEQDVLLEGIGLADEGMALLDEAHELFNEVAAGASRARHADGRGAGVRRAVPGYRL